ncbi:hypothetical protein ASD88_16490 [Pelomonas sp. Root662]|nr:hypothetical protein ASC81_17970 [Pelomonas sp. Root405]KRA71381.1 hypothetical protein ASD88_16490 [Pelomonas sp. Root662]
MVPQARKLTVAAACAFLAACGGGGGGSGGSEGRLQVIDFKYPGGNTLLNGPTTLVATATSGLPVSFRSGTPTTCTVAGENQLTLVAAGECLVIASQPGGAGSSGVKWAAADDTSQLFNVLKRAQVVAFTPPDYVLSTATTSVALSATADSGLPVTFSSDTPAVCAISGSTLNLLAKGSCAVSAKQAGNENYSEQTTQRFIAVDPLLVADGFAPGGGRGTMNNLRTKQGGGVMVNPWASPLNAGWEWCDASAGDWCYSTVSTDGTTLESALHIRDTAYTGGWQYSFNRIDIFAPGLTGFNGSGDTTGGLQVTTEKALGFTLGLNADLYSAGKPVVVHLDLGKRNNGCNVTLSTLVWAPAPGLIGYAVPLSNFAVTEACGLSGVTTASLDNDVRTLPNPFNSSGVPVNAAAFAAGLEKMAASRASAATLLQSSNIVRTRFWLMDANVDRKTAGIFASDLSIKGAITIQ